MDYDDNDFQSQNLHLAGEGSTNCPPVLQTYGLPKFDFDDSLQGHLRFDSLVETEVFLGIESSEANNWIEDFSRGSSGIEFSSSAVESCSISRRNNVWSEATSSESVEMLLKSVGQEEVIPAQTIFEESDACREVGCIKQMEPILKNDDNVFSETGDATDLQSTLLQDEIAGNLAEGQPQRKDSSQTSDIELPVNENLSVLDPNTFIGTNGSLLADGKCNDVDTMDVDNLADPLDRKMHEDSSASEILVDNMITSLQTSIRSNDELNYQGPVHSMMEISEENLSGHLVSKDIEIAVKQSSCHVENIYTSMPVVESVNKENASEASDLQRATSMMQQGDSLLHAVGGDMECPEVIAEAKKCGDMAVSKDPAVGGDESKSNVLEILNDTGYAMELTTSITRSSSSLDPLLEGDSDHHTADKCRVRKFPEILDVTNKCEDVNSVKDLDNGENQCKSNTHDSTQMALRNDSVVENHTSSAGVLSGLDPILKGDSVDTSNDKECPEAPAETNNCEHMVPLKDTNTGGDPSKVSTYDLSPMADGSDMGSAVMLGCGVSSGLNPILGADYDSHTVDGCSDRKFPDIAAETSKCEDVVLFKGTDTDGDKSNMSPHDKSHMAHKSDSGDADEIGKKNLRISSSPDTTVKKTSGKSTDENALAGSSQPDYEILVKMPKTRSSAIDETVKETSGKNTNENTLASSSQPDGEILVKTPETRSSVIDETEVLKGGNDESQEVFCNLSAKPLAAESLNEVHETGTSLCSNDGVGGSTEEVNADSRISPSVLRDSADICVEKEVDGSVGKASSYREDTADKDLLIPTVELEVDGNTSVLPMESHNLASCGTIDAVLLSSENGTTSDIHDSTVVQAASSPAIGSPLDNKVRNANEISKDVSLSCAISSPMVESAPVLVCESDRGASGDTAGQPLCTTGDISKRILISCNTENQRELDNAVANETSKRRTPGTSIQSELSTKSCEDVEVDDGTAIENKSTPEEKSEKESADKSEPNVNCVTNVTELVPSSSVVMGSTGEKAQEDSGTTDVSGDKNCAEAILPNINSDAFRNLEGSLLSASLPEYHAKFGAVDIGKGSADPNQPDCGAAKVSEINEIPETERAEGTISFVADLPTEDDANSSQPIPAVPAPKIAEGSQINSASGQMEAKISQESSRRAPAVSEGEIASGGSKGIPGGKRRRAPSKGMGKESAKKGSVKATTPIMKAQAEREKSSSVSGGKSGVFQFAQPNDMQYYGLVDNSKSFPILTSPTSSLPDLNSSALPSVVFQQPFTDSQQVQLRAQIFVYGALIQGTAPEEAYMVSAFGGPDGGRSIWENVWRVRVGRVHSQRAPAINPDTPLESSSDVRFTGARVPDQVIKQSVLQGNVIFSPVGRATTKGIPLTASPMIPISSPLWSIPTPACETPQSSVVPRGPLMEYHQTQTPLHSFQTSPIMNINEQNSAWMSQSLFHGPWAAPRQPSAAETSIHFSAFPTTESVRLTPVKETTVPQLSRIKDAPSGLAGQTGSSISVFAGASPLLDPKVSAVSPGGPSLQTKSRKRRKESDSKDLGNINFQPRSEQEANITSAVSSSLPKSVAITSPSTFVPKATAEKLLMSVSSDRLKNMEHKATLSEDTVSKAKEARKQAEEASAHAVAAVSHSQEIWNQLDKQKISGSISDAEAKLASAAIAVAAAAAVAKAAAAAANVASNAALQAVLMAEETYGNLSEGIRIFSTEGVKPLDITTPAPVFRVEDGTNSSNSVVATRETAKRSVQAASAASKRAENMDAIVKAAEMAAEAVSQAGIIVAMGDPFSLSELAKAGPDGYWKVANTSSMMVKKSNDRMREQSDLCTLAEDSDISARQLEESQSDEKERWIAEHKKLPTVGEKVTEIIKSASPTAGNDFEEAAQASQDSSILEGSQVEVFKDEDGFGAGWYTATVSSVQDGKACVCYLELQSDEGAEKLQEWVPLGDIEDKPPKIRVARRLTPFLVGTRKRRREAMADYAWSVGDKVDAWIQNSWWEGVVTEKNRIDETVLKVHFPAQGETSHVKAWHLRPSLIWKDGEWVEWSCVRNDCSSMEAGMPQEKRIKLGSPTVEGKAKEKTFKSNDVDSRKPVEPRMLSLSANEQVFHIGKNTRPENKPDAARTNRTGLQKEGSVKFGIPKPKRKFMEVSKHYDQCNDSAKFSKYLMPQASGFRALKNTKDKPVADSKLRGLKSEKQRSSVSAGLTSAPVGSSKMDNTRKIRDRAGHSDGLSAKRNILESGSSYNSDARAQGPVTFSSRTPSDFASSKKVFTSYAKSERGNFAPAGGKLGKIEEGKGTSSNPARSTGVVEPRRSNRRIQPTSRLLEGLQSSLSISKIPSVSHDKCARSQNRNAFKGSNHD